MSTAPTAPPDPGRDSDPLRTPGAHRHPDDQDRATDQTQPPVAMRRTGWDVVLGLLLVVVGAVVLGDVAIASVVSVLFLGWTLIIGGAAAIVLALFRVGRARFWIVLLDGVLSLVTGIVFVRNPKLTLLTLSLVVGALLVAGGIVRIAQAVLERDQRLVLLLSGVVTLVVGVLILNRWPESALWLLGTLLGVQIVVDGLLLMVFGRLRLTT
jgi:uncharacterized membrane protein HdeD (DUF308 family)